MRDPLTRLIVMRAAVEHANLNGVLVGVEEARDHCDTESDAFIARLGQHGVTGERITGFVRDAAGNIVVGHVAVYIEDLGEVWDWTLRQFGDQCDVPAIVSPEEWQDRFQPLGGRR